MLRWLPVLLTFAIAIYCVVDVIQSPEDGIRGLPKIIWVILVLLFPLVGGVAWLLAGRPLRQVNPLRTQQQRWEDHMRKRDLDRPKGPDDDPDFLKDL